MKRSTLSALLLAVSGPAMCAPPPGLRTALEKWSSPRTIARYQFSLVDLNGDGAMDAVVQVTDPSFCGNGGCPLVAFKGAGADFTLVGSSGMVRKPIYVLKEKQAGWNTLAAVVGLGNGAGLVPIHFKQQEGTYRSAPYMNAQIELTSQMTKQVLKFEEAP